MTELCTVLLLLLWNEPAEWILPASMTDIEVRVLIRKAERCERQYLEEHEEPEYV